MMFGDHPSQFTLGQTVEVMTRVPLDESERPEFRTAVVSGTDGGVDVVFDDGHTGSYRPWFVRPVVVEQPGLFDKKGLGS